MDNQRKNGTNCKNLEDWNGLLWLYHSSRLNNRNLLIGPRFKDDVTIGPDERNCRNEGARFEFKTGLKVPERLLHGCSQLNSRIRTPECTNHTIWQLTKVLRMNFTFSKLTKFRWRKEPHAVAWHRTIRSGCLRKYGVTKECFRSKNA